MKPEFYNKSKRSNIYGSIFFYKVASLIILIALTIILVVMFFRDKAQLETTEVSHTPPVFYVMAVCLIFFIISIFIDFYIIHSTVSIGKRLNKLAYIDKLTGIPNRYSCDLFFESFNDPDKLSKCGFILLRINNLMTINADNGHDNGNLLISEFSSILEDVSQEYGYVGRNGGNEFIVIMDDCDSTKIELFLMELTKRIRGYNEMNVGDPLEVAYARTLNSDENKEKISELISLTYKKLREMPLILS